MPIIGRVESGRAGLAACVILILPDTWFAAAMPAARVLTVIPVSATRISGPVDWMGLAAAELTEPLLHCKFTLLPRRSSTIRELPPVKRISPPTTVPDWETVAVVLAP